MRKLFRMKPILVEGGQWFKFGDHERVAPNAQGYPVMADNDGLQWPVAPGDWIMTNTEGKCFTCTPKELEQMFDPVEESYGHKVIFESFFTLEEAREYHQAAGGYLIKSNDRYVVCDKERVLEMLFLRNMYLAEAIDFVKKLQAADNDETKMKVVES